MRNLAVKFALIESRFQKAFSPRAYLDLTSQEGFQKLMALLPDEVKGPVRFAFSETALFEIIENDLEVMVEAGVLTFGKPYLDAQSIARAQDIHLAFSNEETDQLGLLTDWLFKVTRPLYKDSIGHQRTLDIHDEYVEMFRLYYQRYQPTLSEEWLTLLENETHMLHRPMWKQVMQCNIADAIFKSNGAKALLGETSTYTESWFRKSFVRNKMMEAVQAAGPSDTGIRHHGLPQAGLPVSRLAGDFF